VSEGQRHPIHYFAKGENKEQFARPLLEAAASQDSQGRVVRFVRKPPEPPALPTAVWIIPLRELSRLHRTLKCSAIPQSAYTSVLGSNLDLVAPAPIVRRDDRPRCPSSDSNGGDQSGD